MIPRRDGAMVLQAVPERRIERRHDERVLGRDARRHGLPHHPVDVAVVCDVFRVAVVRAERDPGRPELLDQREQVEQVPRHRGLADQEPHPGAQALAPLFDRQRLVVRPDARGGVCLQLLAENAGRMAVDVSSAVEAELLELCRRAGDDAGVVHHLRQPQDAPPTHRGTRDHQVRTVAEAIRRAKRAHTTTP